MVESCHCCPFHAAVATGVASAPATLFPRRRLFLCPCPCACQAASLSALLIQALQTNDNIQLEMCLGVTDDKVVDETVSRIPLAKVVTFLQKLISKFEASPSRGLVLTRWIKSVLIQHTAHLMSIPGLVERLSGLYQTIDTRLTVFKPLLKLSGRLDLVLSQVAIRGAGHNQIGGVSVAQKTLVAGAATTALTIAAGVGDVSW